MIAVFSLGGRVNLLTEIFRADMAYDNIKSHKKGVLHFLFRRYLFGIAIRGLTSPPPTPPPPSPWRTWRFCFNCLFKDELNLSPSTWLFLSQLFVCSHFHLLLPFYTVVIEFQLCRLFLTIIPSKKKVNPPKNVCGGDYF